MSRWAAAVFAWFVRMQARRGGYPSDDAADDGGGDDPAKAIVEAFPINNDGEQDVEVVEVTEPASCLALPNKATTAKEDRRLVELRGKGFTDEQLRAVGAVLSTASRRQRKLPVHAAVCSAVMQAYWAGRDRDRREADCMKAIRNDGGQLGPVRYYESIMVAVTVETRSTTTGPWRHGPRAVSAASKPPDDHQPPEP